jgi:hypothetical protein
MPCWTDFPPATEKRQFLDLIRANEDLGNLETTTSRTILCCQQTKRFGMLARSKQFLPEDVLIRAVLIATSICVGAEDDGAAS